MDYSLILLAAGKGERSGLAYNKVFFPLNDHQRVLDKNLDLFLKDPDCKEIIVMCSAHELDFFKNELKDLPVKIAVGGSTRQESVYNGLQNVSFDHILIHDAARPFVSQTLIERLKTALEQDNSVLPMIPAKDTMKLVDESGRVIETLERSRLFHAQTPQAFKTDLIKAVHEKARENHYTGTDDASLVEVFSDQITRMVPGDESNFKITSKADIERLQNQ